MKLDVIQTGADELLYFYLPPEDVNFLSRKLNSHISFKDFKKEFIEKLVKKQLEISKLEYHKTLKKESISYLFLYPRLCPTFESIIISIIISFLRT